VQNESPTGTDTALLNHPWTGSLRLLRTPICPTCGEPLPPRAFHVITGVAFCVVCATREHYRTLTEAQLIRCQPFAKHCSVVGGVVFYTPRVALATDLRTFAEAVSAEYLYAAFPVTPTGEYIPLAPPPSSPSPVLPVKQPPPPNAYRGIQPE
jgi:hypothetical protein